MKESPETHIHFSEGDIFYTGHAGQYHVSKLLRHDPAMETYHILAFEPLNHEPSQSDLTQLRVLIYHAPIDSKGFKNPKFLINIPLTDDDLRGYREYIVQTHQVDELVRLAKQYYEAGYYLSDDQKHEEAIAKYSLAIELIPSFFEAIDNRAFSKMDLGKWEDAIADFQLSLAVNPESVLAEFSIGECCLRINDRDKAIAQFEKVLHLEPGNVKGIEFLARAKAMRP